MRRVHVLSSVLSMLYVVYALGGASRSPESMGAHWARLSDNAQLQLIVDGLRSAAQGLTNERIALRRLTQGGSLGSTSGASVSTVAAKLSAGQTSDMVSYQMNGTAATISFPSGERLQVEKVNGTWRVTGGSVPHFMTSLNSAEGTSIVGARDLSVGETFIQTPVSREHGIDRLSREVTKAKIGRALFGAPDKTASYYRAHYGQRAPFVSSTYIQFVTDPVWNRLVYGNMDRWIKSYDNVVGPSALAVDADGRVFVGETGNKRVSVLRVTGEGDEASLQFQFSIPGITSPTDIALSDNGTPLYAGDDLLYVADASQGRILKYAVGANSASLVASFDGFDSPTSILVGKWNGVSNGLLYVVDKIAKRIRVYEDLGGELSLLSELKGNYSQYFKSLKADHFGNVYVVDNVNSQVLKYSADLELLDSQGGQDLFASLGNVDVPFGKITVDGQGTYWSGFDQMFAVERWSEASGAQRRILGLGIRNIDFLADRDVSRIDNVFTLTDFGDLSVRVYDGTNRLIRTLASSWMVSGSKRIAWDRRDDTGAQVPAGTYRYEISAKSAYRDEATLSRTQFYLPAYYWENSGSQNQLDDAHLVRGTAVRWGTGISEKVNEDQYSVEYRFTGLNPESEYQVAAEYVSHDGANRLQDMTANGVRLHEALGVTATPVKVGFFKLPKESYAHGEVLISVNKRAEGSAVVSQLWFKETGTGFEAKQIDAVIPTAYALEQNYPNPFNPSTLIRYAIPAEGPVSLKVYDVVGREVATLVNEFKPAGAYEVRFASANALASGVYFYRVKVGSFSETKKMILLK